MYEAGAIRKHLNSLYTDEDAKKNCHVWRNCYIVNNILRNLFFFDKKFTFF